MTKPDTYDMAKKAILSRILAFPTINQKDWENDWQTKPIIGDLVTLKAAPDTDFCVSWVVEIEPTTESSYERHLLRSVLTGELCWWTNVGFNIYKREEVNNWPAWKWTDRQYAFYGRWKKVCYRDNDAYMLLPTLPKFNEDNSVELGTRVRHGFSDYQGKITFQNWKKTTMKMMNEFYEKSYAEYDQYKVKKAN